MYKLAQVVNLGEEATGTWSADGNQVSITIEGDTAAATVENGGMFLPHLPRPA